MTQAQIVFKTDVAMKEATIKKLKKEWSSLKALLQYSMKAYLEGQIRLWIITNDYTWNEELEEVYQEAAKDFEEGKNLVNFEELLKKIS